MKIKSIFKRLGVAIGATVLTAGTILSQQLHKIQLILRLKSFIYGEL